MCMVILEGPHSHTERHWQQVKFEEWGVEFHISAIVPIIFVSRSACENVSYWNHHSMRMPLLTLVYAGGYSGRTTYKASSGRLLLGSMYRSWRSGVCFRTWGVCTWRSITRGTDFHLYDFLDPVPQAHGPGNTSNGRSHSTRPQTPGYLISFAF